MGAIFLIAAVVLGGTAVVYGPIVLGSWWIKRKRLQSAWRADPKQLTGRTKDEYVDILTREAIKAHQEGLHDQAIDACRQILRLDSMDTQASRLLIANLFAAGRFKEAEEVLHQHRIAHPDDHPAMLVPAAIYCERGELDKARMALDHVDPMDLPSEDRALWYNNYAYALSGLGVDLDLAEDYGQQALKLAAPADRQFALRTLGVVYLAKHDYDSAAHRLLEALHSKRYLREGDIEFTRYHLARAYRGMGKNEMADAEFQRIVNGNTPYAEKARNALDEVKDALLGVVA